MKRANNLIEELSVIAALNWPPEQKAYFVQREADARMIKCVKMHDVFSPDQLSVIFHTIGYMPKEKECFKNASMLVEIAKWMSLHYDSAIPETKYVEGFVYSCGCLPVEHAFVKVGNKYIDPTFEKALNLDVCNEEYVALIELDAETMNKYQLETGFYGGLYEYDYLLKHIPAQAEKMRALNPHRK